MPLMKFAAAKIAALPLMLVYVFIGASTDTFMGGSATATTDEGGASNAKTDNKIGVDDDTHRKMVLFGLCLSIVSMTMVSHFVKKELYKVNSTLSHRFRSCICCRSYLNFCALSLCNGGRFLINKRKKRAREITQQMTKMIGVNM